MKQLFWVVLILLVIIYLQYYNKHKQDYNVIQSNLDTINPSVLHEKYPIVIYDQIYEPLQLLKTLFKYLFIKSESKFIEADNITYNSAKYLLLWSYENVNVNVINPIYRNMIKNKIKLQELDHSVKYITIKLKQNQILIIPHHWYFHSTHNIQTIWLYDCISRLQKCLALNRPVASLHPQQHTS